MKKFIIVFALICLVGFSANAQIPVNMNKGDFGISAGMNFGWDFGIGAGVEYIFARVDIAKAVPITFGVAAKAGVDLFYSTDLTVVGLLTAHFGLGFINELPPWLKNFDFYYGFGLGFGVGSTFGIGMGNAGGLAYYIKPNLAIYSSVIYARYFNYTGGSSVFGSLGLIFKL